MAAAVTLPAKERRRGSNIAFQALFYPVTDANFDTTSYLAYQGGYTGSHTQDHEMVLG